ncbi:BRO family protein [Paraburkholderia caballeronis]|uniref:BRO family protein n=1 Tax=Paraburkholderia caballeronis TaxID=416943 RepID=UPI0010648C80|nr:BRO family protein [Paraburkholderia caballeronis]
MMKELMFQNQSIRLIEQDGKQWASAADIARALGYSRPDAVTRIYDKHRIEFTESMTALVMVETADPQNGGLLLNKTMARVFSLRGAHLIAMFARTDKAQVFRRWVLDIIESHQASQSLIQEWFEAKAAVDAQDKFASLCGKGLNEHKRRKPPLAERLGAIAEKLQPSLAFN